MSPDVKAGIRKRLLQVFVGVVIHAAVLFLTVWRLDWVWGWAFIALYAAGICVNGAILLRRNPEVIARRAETRWEKGWDMLISTSWSLVYLLGILGVSGLDARFDWTGQMPLSLHILGVAVTLAGWVLVGWAMMVNPYFSTRVRVYKEQGHTVCTTGPYRLVRHPGYLGAILQSLGIPLMLGSLWALIPGGVAILLVIARTALEDDTLQAELAGYQDYARRVRYRLLPKVW